MLANEYESILTFKYRVQYISTNKLPNQATQHLRKKRPSARFQRLAIITNNNGCIIIKNLDSPTYANTWYHQPTYNKYMRAIKLHY